MAGKPKNRKASAGRTCTRCLYWKQWDKFGLRSTGKNGHESHCLECKREARKTYRIESRPTIRVSKEIHALLTREAERQGVTSRMLADLLLGLSLKKLFEGQITLPDSIGRK